MNKKSRAEQLLYSTWQGMKSRCCNPRQIQYKDYGGRGITVCERWLNSFDNFRADMGERPEGMTLDRIDVNGNYEPGNCRWADRSTQSVNRRIDARNKSGYTGVKYLDKRDIWEVIITRRGKKSRYLFRTKEAAIAYRIKLEKENTI